MRNFGRPLSPTVLLLLGAFRLMGAADSTPCTLRPGVRGSASLLAEARAGARVVAKVDAKSSLKRMDTFSSAAGDWVELESFGKRGWVQAENVVCRMRTAQARQTIEVEVGAVLRNLQGRNMREFSKYVHPVKGVRFSPYGFIVLKSNVRYTAVTIQTAIADQRKLVWGAYDGSGDPIRLTFTDYCKRFLYDRDFSAAPKILYNEGPAEKGNARENSREIYPNAIIVDVHVPGTDPERQGTDWATLRLVFEQHRTRWYLVHIIHDQWTI